MSEEKVNHPKYYNQYPIEVVDMQECELDFEILNYQIIYNYERRAKLK